MTKAQRREVYDKCGGHCAYCGKHIEYKDMQVDHIIPRRRGRQDTMDNYNPACRRCNFYKSTDTIDQFREQIMTVQDRVLKAYAAMVALDYGIIEVKQWDGRFYFEKGARNG